MDSLHELRDTIATVTDALSSYNAAEASRALYEFIWGSVCDWYLEISKVALTGEDPKARLIKQTVLVHVLEQSLALLHPVMPFETEALYQAFKPYLPSSVDSLMIHSWPKAESSRRDQAAGDKMHLVQNVVTSIRTLRSEAVIPPGLKMNCYVRNLDPKAREILDDVDVQAFITSLARLSLLDAGSGPKPEQYLFTVFNGGEVFIAAEGLVDKEKEKARLLKNKGQLEQMLSRGKAALDNKDFHRTRAQRRSGKPPPDSYFADGKKAGVARAQLRGTFMNQIRPIHVTPRYLKHPEGSCLFQMGDTKVLFAHRQPFRRRP